MAYWATTKDCSGCFDCWAPSHIRLKILKLFKTLNFGNWKVISYFNFCLNLWPIVKFFQIGKCFWTFYKHFLEFWLSVCLPKRVNKTETTPTNVEPLLLDTSSLSIPRIPKLKRYDHVKLWFFSGTPRIYKSPYIPLKLLLTFMCVNKVTVRFRYNNLAIKAILIWTLKGPQQCFEFTYFMIYVGTYSRVHIFLWTYGVKIKYWWLCFAWLRGAPLYGAT